MQRLAILKKVMFLMINAQIQVYWTILNNFLDNIKIPSVPPILISGETITNIVEQQIILMNFCFPVYSFGKE